MPSVSSLLSVILLMTFLCAVVSKEDSDKPDIVQIRPWQYCQGCKYTVELYAKVAADRLKQQKKAGGPAAMAGEEILESLCEDSAFFNLQPYMRWSCMKLLGENMNEFLEEFAGQFTATDLINKADNFKRARRICGKHSKACEQKDFQRANVTSSQRTKCNACRIIAEDIEKFELARLKNISLSSQLGNNYCSNLGNRFSPYQWLDHVCEEMIEDKMDGIVGVLEFQRSFRATGLTPDKSTSDMMCEEFFKCPVQPKSASQDEL